jgi:branched-chain amino acid transport system ATP-binding protein
MMSFNKLNVNFGTATVIREASLSIKQGEVVLIRGHFGTGKSTLLKAIIGAVSCDQSLTFLGSKFQRRTPRKMIKAGMSYMSEELGIFRKLTIQQNLELGASLRTGKCDTSIVANLFPDLRKYLQEPAFVLSGGQSRMLAFACAIVGDPKLVLLDEPTQGIAAKPLTIMANAIQKLVHAGSSVLLIEQHANELSDIANRTLIMDQGHLVLEN